MVEKGKMEPLHSKEEGRTAANPMALFKIIPYYFNIWTG